MTSDETAGPGNGKTGPLPFDVSEAHQARMYDYVLGGCFLYAHYRSAGSMRKASNLRLSGVITRKWRWSVVRISLVS